MPRTTVNIDGPVFRDLKRRQKREGKPLGRLVSDLLTQALASPPAAARRSRFSWASRAMRARVDLADKDAVQDVLAREDRRRLRV
jgi:hypothetical protein